MSPKMLPQAVEQLADDLQLDVACRVRPTSQYHAAGLFFGADTGTAHLLGRVDALTYPHLAHTAATAAAADGNPAASEGFHAGQQGHVGVADIGLVGVEDVYVVHGGQSLLGSGRPLRQIGLEHVGQVSLPSGAQIEAANHP